MKAKILFMFGLIFFASAMNIITTNLPAALYAMDKTTEAHRKLLTVPQVGWLFLALSLMWMICAVYKRLINFGYSTMMFVASFWGLLYIVSWTLNGEWRAVYAATLYWLIAGILYVTSSQPELIKGEHESLSTPLPFELIQLLKNEKGDQS